MQCPKCGSRMWRAMEGLICTDCGLTMDTRHKCPACGRPTRARLDGRPGRWCERCACDVTPVEQLQEEPPYRSPTHALYALIWAATQAGASPSDMGPKLDRLEIGTIQTSGRKQISREYEILGELVGPWQRLDGEDQVLLWEWGAASLWLEQGARCRKCGHEYQPAWQKRCDCGQIRPQDEELCVCGSKNWRPVECCPRCQSKDRARARTRAKRTARAVSEHRMQLFREAHTGSVDGETAVVLAKGLRASTGALTRHGYCWRCQMWWMDADLLRGRKCPECGQRVRWGLKVSDASVTKMVPNSLTRWRGLLQEGRLVA